jgi:uncharacterized protein YjiS (DUF1127 family)
MGWTLHPSEGAAGEAANRQFHSSDLAAGWLRTPLFWIERSRQRRQLRELADLNNHLLKDIGVSQEQALREASKPFWR